MIQAGLNKIAPRHTDFSLLHTFFRNKYGAIEFDTQGLPQSYSCYDGRVIPNQNEPDARFFPPLPPMPEGCTAEAVTFSAGIQDGKFFNPQYTYSITPPYNNGGRDIRDAMKSAKEKGLKDNAGQVGFNRGDYYNCYGAGKIDDFDAARAGLWINQIEKRPVIVGTWWYPEYESIGADGYLPTPSFKTNTATLHAHLVTGFDSTYKDDYLEDISWQGMNYGNAGKDYISRSDYNRLMTQPYTGAFTQAKSPSDTYPSIIGYQAYIDHFIYWFRHLFNV